MESILRHALKVIFIHFSSKNFISRSDFNIYGKSGTSEARDWGDIVGYWDFEEALTSIKRKNMERPLKIRAQSW